MLEIIAIIAVAIVAVVVVALAYAATKPDTFRVQRSTSIKAPPEKIFALVNDLCSHAVMSLVCNMDKMIGKEFETGLANLKSLTEK